MRIGIIGCRGIPNRYGGFEQIASFLSAGLAARGHDVTVYNSSTHPFKEKIWNGVHIIHCYDPEWWVGTAGQFIYDLNCIRDARRKKYDILFILGYTSSSVWGRFYPSRTVVITNMDGLEWKRTKYAATVRRFLKYAEKLAVKHSHFHIADSVVIKEYLDNKYGIDCRFIPYGADIPLLTNTSSGKKYYLIIARMEKENNIEMILDGYRLMQGEDEMIIVGDTSNHYGKQLMDTYKNDARIVFKGPVFERDKVDELIAGSCLYFHGHSVGGTNPSLLEAMAANAMIAAHDNLFNRAILGNDAVYFSGAEDISKIISTGVEERGSMVKNNLDKISTLYTWERIINEHEQFFTECLSSR